MNVGVIVGKNGLIKSSAKVILVPNKATTAEKNHRTENQNGITVYQSCVSDIQVEYKNWVLYAKLGKKNHHCQHM